MKSYLFSGHNIETADEMKCAMEWTDGIPGVRVAVCLPLTDTAPICKLEGVSYINNIEYNDNGMIIWKADKIGKGKLMLWNNLNLPTTLPRLSKTHPENPETLFVSIKPRKKSSESLVNQEAESSEDDDQFDNEYDDFEGITDDKKLFFCPEEGCIKSFQRYSSFQKHLDSERHKYSPENMTLYDKTLIQYAKKLEQGTSSVTSNLQDQCLPPKSTDWPEVSELSTGWALKTAAPKKRFTETQKKFLIDVFQNGENTGHKEDPAEVAKSMRKTRNLDGTRMFERDSFLTPRQISSFFSRQAKKKVLCSASETAFDDINEDEEVPNVEEQNIQELTDEVISAIGIRHPIVYGAYNICELSSNLKLTEFSINMLKEICTSMELDTSQITVKRKKPYVELIDAIVSKCSCSANEM